MIVKDADILLTKEGVHWTLYLGDTPISNGLFEDLVEEAAALALIVERSSTQAEIDKAIQEMTKAL